MDKIDKEFKKIGFIYVTLDMLGYRTGSFNKGRKDNFIMPIDKLRQIVYN